MPLENTAQHWGWLSKTLHWLTALLIFVQITPRVLCRKPKAVSLKNGCFCLAQVARHAGFYAADSASAVAD